MFGPVTLTVSRDQSFHDFTRAAQREFWYVYLCATKGNVRQAARLAGVKRTTAIEAITRVGLSPKDFRA